MRHYEIVFFVHPDQSTQVPSMVERYKNIVTEAGGTIHRHEDWGRRRLAYPIVKIHKAHYVLFNIECNQEVIASLQHAFRFNDAVLRHLIISVPEPVTEMSLMAKKQPDADAEADESESPSSSERTEKSKPAYEAPQKEDVSDAEVPLTEAVVEPSAVIEQKEQAVEAEEQSEPATQQEVPDQSENRD